MHHDDRPTRIPTLLATLTVALSLVAPTLANAAAPDAPAKRPDLYDTRADTRAVVASASARARRDATRVLVMFGFNTCGWCHKLHDLFAKDPAVRKALHDEYSLAMVDIQAPNAEELLTRCKAALPEDERGKVGYPFLAVLDADGKVVTSQRTDPLEVGDHHDPAKVLAFLQKWTAPPRDAKAVVDEALAKATSEDKRVFLHFGAPWCGWCHKLDDFLAREDVAKVIGRDYLDVKVDVDRMTNGKDVLARYNPGASGGIPWFVILDPTGKALATSDGPKGNIGYPAQPEEIAHFLTMLRKTARRIEPAQIESIEAALREQAAKLKVGN